MPDRLFCSRIHEDGRCDHPVTGQRHGDVVPDEHRATCAACGHAIRRDPAYHPELEAICVDHLDDEEMYPSRAEGPRAGDDDGPVGECPGGLTWDCCHADDCGVAEDGTGCDLARAGVDGE